MRSSSANLGYEILLKKKKKRPVESKEKKTKRVRAILVICHMRLSENICGKKRIYQEFKVRGLE